MENNTLYTDILKKYNTQLQYRNIELQNENDKLREQLKQCYMIIDYLESQNNCLTEKLPNGDLSR